MTWIFTACPPSQCSLKVPRSKIQDTKHPLANAMIVGQWVRSHPWTPVASGSALDVALRVVKLLRRSSSSRVRAPTPNYQQALGLASCMNLYLYLVDDLLLPSKSTLQYVDRIHHRTDRATFGVSHSPLLPPSPSQNIRFELIPRASPALYATQRSPTIETTVHNGTWYHRAVHSLPAARATTSKIQAYYEWML